MPVDPVRMKRIRGCIELALMIDSVLPRFSNEDFVELARSLVSFVEGMPSPELALDALQQALALSAMQESSTLPTFVTRLLSTAQEIMHLLEIAHCAFPEDKASRAVVASVCANLGISIADFEAMAAQEGNA